jgi:DNA-binding NarL/FixJ family response regulator
MGNRVKGIRPFLVAVRRLARCGTGQQPAKGMEATMLPRILIVDDSSFIRLLVRRCIEANTEWNICGEAENGMVAVEKVIELHPDVVILDLQMPVMDGLEAARQITRIAPNTVLLMFTMHKSKHLLEAAKAAGIREVVSKSDSVTEHLLASLRNMCAA